jgi:alkylated DNA repair dioxygenase AlkB
MRAPITYTPTLLGHEHGTKLFNQLWNGLDWLRIDKVPRREYYVAENGRDYSYGRPEYARTYKSQPLTKELRTIWDLAERYAGCRFDVVFLNGYEDGTDHLGWHSDNSPEMDDNRPIAIVSLGAWRDIWFRPIEATQPGFSVHFGMDALRLEHGSLCLMAPGMQDTHQHRIPKAGRVCGPRISLTFRGYVEPKS